MNELRKRINFPQSIVHDEEALWKMTANEFQNAVADLPFLRAEPDSIANTPDFIFGILHRWG